MFKDPAAAEAPASSLPRHHCLCASFILSVTKQHLLRSLAHVHIPFSFPCHTHPPHSSSVTTLPSRGVAIVLEPTPSASFAGIKASRWKRPVVRFPADTRRQPTDLLMCAFIPCVLGIKCDISLHPHPPHSTPPLPLHLVVYSCMKLLYWLVKLPFMVKLLSFRR